MQTDTEHTYDLPKGFSLEHWLALYRHVPNISEPPYELAPWPTQIWDDETLLNQLAEWELYDRESNQVDDDLTVILQSITFPDAGLWGTIEFPRYVADFDLNLPDEAKEWGVDSSVTVSGRVPFMVAAKDGMAVALLSTQQCAYINVDISARPFHLSARDLLANMIDPEGTWSPSKQRTVTVPSEAMEKLGGDYETVHTALAAGGKKAGMFQSTAEKIAPLFDGEPDCLVTIMPMNSTDEGQAATLLIYRGDDLTLPGVTLATPGVSKGQNTVTYTPATDHTVSEGLKNMLQKN